jgi:hypothetical protein
LKYDSEKYFISIRILARNSMRNVGTDIGSKELKSHFTLMSSPPFDDSYSGAVFAILSLYYGC